jgi:tRNA-dihydrouridine synthase 4
MAARGLLNNPALFAGYKTTPWGALERFMNYAMTYGLPYRLTLHHVGEMMEGMVTRKERARMLEQCGNVVQLLDWLDERYVLRRKGEEGFSESESLDAEKRIQPDGS